MSVVFGVAVGLLCLGAAVYATVEGVIRWIARLDERE